MWFLVTLFLSLAAPAPATAACPVTIAASPAFIPPLPYSPAPLGEGAFLFGTDALWVGLPNGPWKGLRHKVFWWRPGFNGANEQRPNLTLTIRPVNGSITASVDSPATNAHFGGEWAMLIMVDFPSPGCWELKGSYGGHTVTFVADVTP